MKRFLFIALMMFLTMELYGITFKAHQSQSTRSILTLTVTADSSEAVIIVPASLFANYAWPPQVAVLTELAGAWYGDCHHPSMGKARTDELGAQSWGKVLGYCIDEIRPTILANGTAEIRVPREWFRRAALRPYEVYTRYKTCLETNGQVDTWYAQPCPPLDLADRGRGNQYEVARPPVGLPIKIQMDSSGTHAPGGKFLFLAEDTTWMHGQGWEDHDPDLFGELERIYNWLESTKEPAIDVPKVSQILTHVFAGPLANATAETEITITNRTGKSCTASVLFHRGTEHAPQVRFNGQHLDENRLDIDIGGGSVRRIVLTADPGQDLAVGAAYVEQETGCTGGALQVEGRYLITSQDGQIMEAFSVLPQMGSDWLSDGNCRLLSSSFGGRDNVGLAMVTVRTGEAAPSGTRMTFEAYDWQDNFIQEPPSLEVTGTQLALNPWNFSEPRLVKLCLDVPDDQPKNFRLSLISIAARVSSRNIQYSSSALIRPGEE